MRESNVALKHFLTTMVATILSQFFFKGDILCNGTGTLLNSYLTLNFSRVEKS